MWPANCIRGMNRTVMSLMPPMLIAACEKPVEPRGEQSIEAYVIFGEASGTDPETGEQLACAFSIQNFPTGGPLIGTWTDTTTIRMLRIRTSASQQVTHDTTMAGQVVTLTVSDSAHIQLTVTGPLTQTLNANLDPNYPGTGLGDWNCGPEQPLARVQPGLVLTGRWQTQPAVNVFID